MDTVMVRTFAAPPVNRSEILRYACCAMPSPEEDALVDACLREAEAVLEYRVIWCRGPLKDTGESLQFGFAETASRDLRRALGGCDSWIAFGATLGLRLDRLIARAGSTEPAKALIYQAIGAERIEALCEAFCDECAEEAKKSGGYLTPRFSPGYGDLSLEFQKDLFALLGGQQIGLTLGSSLLMSPSKSVTALMGIAENPAAHAPERCRSCFMKSCAYRRKE